MDTTAKLIICVILGAFYVPTASAYNLHGPEVYDNLQIVDGELHVKRPGGGTSHVWPDIKVNKEIPVNTSKGNYLVPVEKTFPVEPSKVGKAATRFLKTLPLIGTAAALYDTVCDLTDICKNPQSGELEYAPDIPNGYPAIGEAGRWQHASNSAINEPTLELLCKNSSFKSTFFYSPAFLIYVSSSSSGINGTCVYRDTSNNPPTTLERDGFAKRNSGTCSANYTLVSGTVARPVTLALVSAEVDWSKVGACVSTTKKCICYGKFAEKLVIPPETCRKAVTSGWPGQETKI